MILTARPAPGRPPPTRGSAGRRRPRSSSPSIRPQCASRPSSILTDRSEVLHILVQLPVGHPLRWRSTSKRFIARKVSTTARRARRAGTASASSASSAAPRSRGARRPGLAAVGVAGDRRGRARARARSRRGRRSSSAAIAEVRVGAAVADAHLDPGRAAALGRDADERGAVVPAPVGVGRREGVGDEPPVGVDRRVQEAISAGAVLEHARDEVARIVAEPVGAVGVVERVVALASASEM